MDLRPITETLLLDHCWVCTVSKVEQNVLFEEHHVVPRSYGGENGPTVTLCEHCHGIAHKLAETLYKGGYPKPPYEVPDYRTRSLYLATVICNARLVLDNINDPNKRMVYSGFFTGEEHAKLKRLAKHYRMSQHKLIVYAIAQLHDRTFIK